jgi:thiol-disulfide isomerase/thioredoxin
MNNKQTIIIVLVGILVAGVLLILPKEKPSKYKNLDQFASCLSEKGAVMYGAYWCGHCKNEKEAFGKSFKFVNYVECTEEVKLCTDEGIKAYPTWKFPEGKIFEGEMGLENLAKESGCVLEPKELVE